MPNPTFQAIVSAVNESTAAFRAIRTDLGAVKKEADLARESLVKLDRPGGLANLRASAQALTGHFGALNGKIGETHGFLKTLFPVIGAFGAFGAFGSIAGIIGLVNKVAESRVEFNMMADKIGISTRALGQFMFAAKMTHVPAEAMETGLVKLNKALGEAGMGKSKVAAAILQRLGFNLKDVHSGAVTAADVLPRLAFSFSRTENAAIKTAVATALLGKGGAALIPMLNKGSEAWQKYAAEAAKFRYAFTPEDNRNLEEYEQSTIRLDTAVKGITNAIAAGLAPVLTPLNNQMADWIAANREWIATGITGVVSDFSSLIQQQDWHGIGEDMRFMATGAKDVAAALGVDGLKPVLEVLVGLKVGSWLIGIGGWLFKFAAGLDAVTNALPGFVAAWALVPGWLIALMRTGAIGTGAYLGFTIGSNAIGSEQQEREIIERERAGRPRDAEGGGRGGAPGSSYVPPSMPTAAELSRIIQGQPTPSVVRVPPTPPPPPTAPLIWPETFPTPGRPEAPLAIFPSPYAPDLRARPSLAKPQVDGQLRIQIDIPNLPDGARVKTETTGTVPDPDVNVGRSDPMSPF
jgi:hypothetical protein